MDPEGLLKVWGKAPGTRCLLSEYSRGAAGAGTSPPAQPGQAAHRCMTAPRVTRPSSATRAWRGEGQGWGVTERGGGARPALPDLAEGARRGVRRRKDAQVGRGRSGGGVPGRTLTHRFALHPAELRGGPRSGFRRACLLPRLNVQRGCAELRRSPRERRVCSERSRGGGEDGTVVLAATTDTADTVAAGSPPKLRTLPPHPPPAFQAARWRNDSGTGQSEALRRPGPAG